MSKETLLNTIDFNSIYTELPDTAINDIKVPGRFIDHLLSHDEGLKVVKRKTKIQQNFYFSKTRQELKIKKIKKTSSCTFVNKIDHSKFKYDDFINHNELWKEYFNSIMKGYNDQWKCDKISNKLMKADYHGASLLVEDSKQLYNIGLSGIILQETQQAFTIISKSNKIYCIPKKNTVLSVTSDIYSIKIYGNNFRARPGDRIIKKVKPQSTIQFT